MADLIDRQKIKARFEPWLKVKGYSEGELNMLKAVLYEITVMPSAQPDVPDTNVGDMISRQAEIERIDRIFRDLNIACAYDMPIFWYNKGKDYAVIPTKYHKGYQRALEDAEARIMDALKDGEQDG